MEPFRSLPSTSGLSSRPRKRKIKKDNVDSPALEKLKSRWTEAEMRTVMTALNEHGLTKLETISELLPYKSTEQLKLWLWKLSRYHLRSRNKEYEADTVLSQEDCAVGVAISLFGRGRKFGVSERQISAISKPLLLITALEDHPPVHTSHDVDFKKLYNALYMTMKGYPLPPLNEATLRFFHESCQYLLKAALANPIDTTPCDDEERLQRIAEADQLNPLSMEVDFLKAKTEIETESLEGPIKIRDWLSHHDWNLI